MKTTYLFIVQFLFMGWYCMAQIADEGYHVIKEYDKDGNLIRYDSVRKSSHAHFDVGFDAKTFTIDKTKLDSLQKKFNSLHDGFFMFKDDVIVIQRGINADAFSFSMGDALAFAEKWENHLNDSIAIKRLQKAKEHIEKRLKTLKQRKKQKSN